MQPTTTILLISSPHLNWERLGALLAKQRHAQVVGEVHRHDEAARVVAAVSSQKAGATGAVCQDAPSMRIAARGAMRLARLGNWHAPETRS